MKICHVSTVHQRDDIRIFLKECKALRDFGEVHFMVADGMGDSVQDRIRILDIGQHPQQRLQRFFFSFFAYRKIVKKIDADIYHIHDPELIPAALALKLKNKIVIYDAHEDLPRQILSKPYLRPGFARVVAWFAEVLENYAARHLDAVVCATRHIYERYLPISRRAVLVNNFPSLVELGFETMPERRMIEKRACYIGGISTIRGACQMAEAAKVCKYPIYCAGVVESEQLKRELFKANQNMMYACCLPIRELGEFIAESFVGLVLFLPVPNHVESMPTKLFEYMAAGIPVIASNFPLWKTIVEDGGCGICVNPENPKEIASAIEYVIDHPEIAQEMGKKGRKLVEEKYNWRNEVEKLRFFYASIVKDK